MAKKKPAQIPMPIAYRLADQDWITIIGALLHDRSAAGPPLGRSLLAKTKQGRQIRLLRMLNRKRPLFRQIQRALMVSRRTVFRDLNGLRDYGVQLMIDEKWRYHISRLPSHMRRYL